MLEINDNFCVEVLGEGSKFGTFQEGRKRERKKEATSHEVSLKGKAFFFSFYRVLQSFLFRELNWELISKAYHPMHLKFCRSNFLNGVSNT